MLRINSLLKYLPVADRDRLLQKLEPVPLKLRQTLYKTRGRIDHVYFPVSGIVSAMTVMADGTAIEVATIGKEGMVGLTAFIGGETSPYEVMVQVAGAGLRMKARDIRAEAERDGPLRDVLVRYNTAFATQVSYSVACNGLHKIQQRCCRWLLTTHDRVGSNNLALTHEFLAIMLGVRRASVTEVLKPYQANGALRSHRGAIEILDRSKLLKCTCECYQAVADEFHRLMGP